MNTLDLTPYARNNSNPSPKSAEAYIHQDLFITLSTHSPWLPTFLSERQNTSETSLRSPSSTWSKSWGLK